MDDVFARGELGQVVYRLAVLGRAAAFFLPYGVYRAERVEDEVLLGIFDTGAQHTRHDVDEASPGFFKLLGENRVHALIVQQRAQVLRALCGACEDDDRHAAVAYILEILDERRALTRPRRRLPCVEGHSRRELGVV